MLTRAPASRRRESARAGDSPRPSRSSGAGRDRPDELPRLLAEDGARRLGLVVESDASAGREQSGGDGSAAAGAVGTGGRTSRRRRARPAARCVRGLGWAPLGSQPRVAGSRSGVSGGSARPTARRTTTRATPAHDRARRPGPPARGGRGRRARRHERERRHDEESQRAEDVPSHEVTARSAELGSSGLLDGASAARPAPVRVRRSRPPSSSSRRRGART